MTVYHGNYIEYQHNQTYLQMLFIVRDAYIIQGVIETVNLKKKKYIYYNIYIYYISSITTTTQNWLLNQR